MRRLSGGAFVVPVLVGAIAIAWVAGESGAAQTYPPEWDALGGDGLVALAKDLADQGDAGKPPRAELIAFVSGKYLAGTEQTRLLTCYHWRELAWYLRGDMSDEVRGNWAGKIRQAFAGTREQLLGLDAASLAYLARALGSHLGHGEVAPQIATYVVEKDTWKALDLFELDWLSCMSWAAGGLGNEARKRLGDHLTATQFSDAANVRTAGVTVWKWFTFYLGGTIPNETREAWATKLYEAFASTPEAVAGLKAEDRRTLEDTLRALCQELPPDARKAWFARLQAAFIQNDAALAQMGSPDIRSLVDSLVTMDPGQAGRLALKWFQTHDGWRNAPAADLVYLAYAAAQGDATATAAMMGDLEGVWVPADTNEPLDLSAIYHLAHTWTLLGDKEKARTWVMRAYNARLGTEAARNSVDVVSLGRLADFMAMVDLTGKDKGYPGFAVALARHAREGTLAEGLANYAPRTYWAPCDPAILALPLGTAETRQTLRDELLDVQGNPRLGAAKVLSVAYQAAGEQDGWLGFLDQKLKDVQNVPDAKARWLLVRGYAAAARSTPPSPLGGRQWLEEALTTTSDASIRSQALRELVDGYVLHRRYDDGLAFLGEVRGRFADPETAKSISALEVRVKDAKAQDAAMAEQARARAAALHREVLQRRLAAARARGDAEAVARYERLLGLKP